MTPFQLGYLTCALWSSNDESDDSGGEPLDKNYTIDDIAPDSLARMWEECRAFEQAQAADLAEYVRKVACPREDSPLEWAGHDLWLTRNGHGAGFWDRRLGALGQRLTDAARKLGECNLYVGDDGRIHAT